MSKFYLLNVILNIAIGSYSLIGLAWTMVKMWKPLNFEEEGPDFSDFERVGGKGCVPIMRGPLLRIWTLFH